VAAGQRGQAHRPAGDPGGDRNQPGRYFAIVFFDSYESAMENSKLPETQAAAEKYMALADAPPVFYDLDVIEDRA
jgi:hypothetical protein